MPRAHSRGCQTHVNICECTNTGTEGRLSPSSCDSCAATPIRTQRGSTLTPFQAPAANSRTLHRTPFLSGWRPPPQQAPTPAVQTKGISSQQLEVQRASLPAGGEKKATGSLLLLEVREAHLWDRAHLCPPRQLPDRRPTGPTITSSPGGSERGVHPQGASKPSLMVS